MKTSLLVVAALMGLTSADHRCDDGETGDTNQIGPALLKAYEKAKQNKDAAFKNLQDFNTDNAGSYSDVKAAQENLAHAQAQYDISCGRTEQLNQAYDDASQAFADCKPDDPDSKCDTSDHNLLSFKMVEAGKIMIDNDNQCNKARNELQQFTLEHNEKASIEKFNAAALSQRRTRLEQDLESAAVVYQNFKDQVDRYDATGTEDQRNCKINQYHNDMAEIERLGNLINECKTEQCDEVTAFEYEDIEYVGILPEFDSTMDGPIKFPDCGMTVSGECFWQNYKQSGLLDFLSFFMYGPALMGCTLFSEYEYGFCFSNFAYVLVDAFSKKIAPRQLIGLAQEAEHNDGHDHAH